MDIQKYLLQFIVVVSAVYFITRNRLSSESVLYIALASVLGFVLLENLMPNMLEGFPGIDIANCVATKKKEAADKGEGPSNITIERPTEPPNQAESRDADGNVSNQGALDANKAARSQYAIDLKKYQAQFKDLDKNTQQLRADCCKELGLQNDPACSGGGGGGGGNPGDMSQDAWCASNPHSASCRGVGQPETTAGEPTAPEITAPEPTAPEITAPEPTAPETTAPETATLETTAGETTETPPATTPGKTKVVAVDNDCPWYKWISFQC